ncbi:MAG TPA: TIGR00645 family protein [Steroidobacteraceae bacterium]|nr:TIGR00645 family protein [Steroidobacteraceae bacterium]
MRHRLEVGLEWILFTSRWLLAPFYVGMIFAVAAILVVFVRELITELGHLDSMNAEQVILLALSLIDLSLTGNLLLIVIFSGYENFVSKIHVGEHQDRPSWMGTVDFSGLKIKLVASIVAISAIALLRAFLPLGEPDERVDSARLGWMVAIHLTFVVSGVLLAVMDWITSRTAAEGGH